MVCTRIKQLLRFALPSWLDQLVSLPHLRATRRGAPLLTRGAAPPYLFVQPAHTPALFLPDGNAAFLAAFVADVCHRAYR